MASVTRMTVWISRCNGVNVRRNVRAPVVMRPARLASPTVSAT